MAQPLPSGYLFDPEDPRAPALDQWNQMLPDERARVVAMLPAEVPLDLVPNEDDPQRKAKRGALDALFQRTASNAPLEDADEMIARLGSRLDEALAGQEEADRLAEELSGKLADTEQQLAEARAEIERLKNGSP
jgi:hypothetical protein